MKATRIGSLHRHITAALLLEGVFKGCPENNTFILCFLEFWKF